MFIFVNDYSPVVRQYAITVFSLDLSAICFAGRGCVAFFYRHGILRTHAVLIQQKRGIRLTASRAYNKILTGNQRAGVALYRYRRKGCAFFSRLKLRISEMASPSRVRAVPTAAIIVMRSCSTSTAVITVTTGTR